MARHFLIKRLIPSLILFLAVPALAIGVDLVLHWRRMPEVGTALGPIGTGVLAISFVYSLRKRQRITLGSPVLFLRVHEILGWSAAILLVVHAGIHTNAWIPWLGVLLLLVVTASGVVGRHLLAEARHELSQRRAELVAAAVPSSEIEERLTSLALLTKAMQQWRGVHMPLTAILLALAMVHVLGILLLG